MNGPTNGPTNGPARGSPGGDGRGEKSGAPGGGRAGARDGGDSRLAKLRIMAKEVTIACRPGEEEALEQAAAYIDRSMRELKSRNTTSSIEKIAIVTAINTADALLRSRVGETGAPSALERVAAMNARLETLLGAHGSEPHADGATD